MANFLWPLEGGRERWPITRGAEDHVGDGEGVAVDLACNSGVPVLAVHDATVARAGSMGQCGIGLDIAWQEDGDQWQVRYCHLSEIAQASGEVSAGQVIGYAGNTGWSTGPHLHLVIWKNEARVDPEQCLRTPIMAPAAPGDRVLRALNIVWGWADRLDEAELSVEDQAQAAAEMKGVVVAVKEEAGLQLDARPPGAVRPSALGLSVQNRRGEEIGAAVEAAASEFELDPIAVLALIKAESNLDPYAERWGRRTDEAAAAIKDNDTATLQAIVDEQWPDISFGYSQRIVLFHDLGNREQTAENCLAVRLGVFDGPNEDLRAAARRLAGCFQHPTCDGTALSAMVVYNAGSDRRGDPVWFAAWAGNVACYERALQWADKASATSPTTAPVEADPVVDQLQHGLNVIWGWSERLEAGTLTDEADRKQAAHELRGAAIAVKEAMGLNG